MNIKQYSMEKKEFKKWHAVGINIYSTSSGREIGQMYDDSDKGFAEWNEDDEKEAEANAKMAAAAPELLEALITYHNILVCNKPFSGKDLDKAENAINKALGKEE